MSNRNRNKGKQDKADYLVSKLMESGVLKEGSVYQIDVLHDDGCNYQSGECDCHPVLRIIDMTLEASWDLNKLPKGIRAKEGEISVIRRRSNFVN